MNAEPPLPTYWAKTAGEDRYVQVLHQGAEYPVFLEGDPRTEAQLPPGAEIVGVIDSMGDIVPFVGEEEEAAIPGPPRMLLWRWVVFGAAILAAIVICASTVAVLSVIPGPRSPILAELTPLPKDLKLPGFVAHLTIISPDPTPTPEVYEPLTLVSIYADERIVNYICEDAYPRLTEGQRDDFTWGWESSGIELVGCLGLAADKSFIEAKDFDLYCITRVGGTPCAWGELDIFSDES